jgi:hypothetical protein
VLSDTALLIRNTATPFHNNEPVSRQTLSDFPNTEAVSRKTSVDFPLTELFSTDIAAMFTDIQTMLVCALQITCLAMEFAGKDSIKTRL